MVERFFWVFGRGDLGENLVIFFNSFVRLDFGIGVGVFYVEVFYEFLRFGF